MPLDGFHVSRSLRRVAPRFDDHASTRAFDAVMRACADPARPHGWIDDELRRRLRRCTARLGAQHRGVAPEGELAGGVYGVAIGGLFVGESMFHRVTDASKVALAALVDHLRDGGAASSTSSGRRRTCRRSAPSTCRVPSTTSSWPTPSRAAAALVAVTAVVERYLDAIIGHDWNALAACLSDDGFSVRPVA